MPFGILQPGRWRRQPQGRVEIDWANPLARGLVAAWSGATPDINLVTRGQVTVSGTRTIEVGPRGRALKSTAGSGDYVQLLTDAETPTSQYAVTVLYRKTDTTNRVSTAFGDSANASFHIYLPFSDGVVYFDFGGTSGSRRLTASGLAFGDDVWTFQAADAGLQIWQNGVPRASNSAGVLTTNIGAFWIGRAFGANADNALTTLALLHTRGLSSGEVAQLHDNPWQVLRPRRLIIYSLPASGIPVLSGSTVIDIGQTSARPRVTITY
jgi:hypothetical protein